MRKSGFARANGHSGFLRSVFTQSDPGELRMRIDDGRHRRNMRRTHAAGDALGHGAAFVGSLMRKLRTFDDVSYGPHTGQIGTALIIGFNNACGIHGQAYHLRIDAFDSGTSADCHKKFFKRARFLDAVALERDVDAFCATLHVNNEHSQFKL